MTSFLLLIFSNCHAGNVSSFFHSLSTAAFASGIFIAWCIGMNLCTKWWCNFEFSPFPAMCSSWILFVTDSILSHGFKCFSNTTGSCFCFRCFGVFFFLYNGFPDAALGERSFAWHRSCHCSLQLSPCIFNDVFVLFITRINRINSLKFLAYSSFGFSIAHSCLSLLWAAFPNLVQASGHKWSGRDVVWIFVSPSPDHKNPFGGVSFNNVNLVKPFHESEKCFPRHSNKIMISFFLSKRPNLYEFDLVTSIYFSGIRNDSSLGPYNWTLGSMWWRWMKFPWIGQESFRISSTSSDSSGWTLPYRLDILRWDSLSLRSIPVS